MADAIGMLGYKIDDRGKLLISRIRDWGKALGVELLAGFGPTGLLQLSSCELTAATRKPRPN